MIGWKAPSRGMVRQVEVIRPWQEAEKLERCRHFGSDPSATLTGRIA